MHTKHTKKMNFYSETLTFTDADYVGRVAAVVVIVATHSFASVIFSRANFSKAAMLITLPMTE